MIEKTPYNMTNRYGRIFPKDTVFEMRRWGNYGGGINWLSQPVEVRPVLNGNALGDWTSP